MKICNWLFLITMVTLMSCEKSKTECYVQPPEQFSEFIFGTYYGECGGEGCIETFKIENGTLFEDEKDSYGGPFPYPGEWKALDPSKYELAEDLPNDFPSPLFDEPETTIGMPDAGDWGGIYLEVVTKKGHRLHWNIDTMKDHIPEYLHAFVESLQNTIIKINE